MTTHTLMEDVVRERLHAFAETLPVEPASAWREIVSRPPVASEQNVVLWPGVQIPRRRGHAHRRLAVLAVAATTVMAAAIIGALTVGTHPAAGTPALPEPLAFEHGSHDAAVALLQQAAAQQDNANDVGAGPVRYAKTRSYALQADIAHHVSTTTVETTLRQVWIAGDGSAVATSATQDTTRSGMPVGQPQNANTDQHWQDSNPTLSTDAASLRTALLGSGANGDDTNLVLAQAIMSHLGQATTTPVQTAALYRLLATLPGTFDAGAVIDNAGRSGHAVGILSGYFDAGSNCTTVSGPSASVETQLARNGALGQGISYLVVDSSTGQPLEVETVETPNPPCGLGLPAGATIEQYDLILKTGRVATTGATVR
jgi:hypothetical protein